MDANEQRALDEFTEYFVKNYPGPNTIIGNPNWHAPRIFRAAKRALAQQVPADGEWARFERAKKVNAAWSSAIGIAKMALMQGDSAKAFAALDKACDEADAIYAATPQAPQPVVDASQPQQGAVDHATDMEGWHGAINDACEIAGNTTDQRIVSRASRIVTWLKAHKPNATIGQQAVDDAGLAGNGGPK